MDNKTKLGLEGLAFILGLGLSTPKKADALTIYRQGVNGATPGDSVFVMKRSPQPPLYFRDVMSNDSLYSVALPPPWDPYTYGDSTYTKYWNSEDTVWAVTPGFPGQQSQKGYVLFFDGHGVNQQIEYASWVDTLDNVEATAWMNSNPGETISWEVPKDAGVYYANSAGNLALLSGFAEDAPFTILYRHPSHPFYETRHNGTVSMDCGDAQGEITRTFPEIYVGSEEKNSELENKLSFQSIGNGSFKTSYSGFVEVYDASGRKVRKSLVQNGALNLSGLKEGIYFAKTDKGTEKLILIE